jgi:hypothetical protein
MLTRCVRRSLPAGGLVLVLLGVAVTASGCGSGLSASSSCQAFVNASPDDQHAIVCRLAVKYNKPMYATPVGQPEVPFYCASHPKVTLAQFFEQAAG